MNARPKGPKFEARRAESGGINVAKNRHLGTIAQLCRAISSQLRHLSTIGKQLVKHQYVLHVLAEIGSTIWGTPALQISTGFASWQR